MDILVYKDGRMVCTENPLKAGSLEGLAMLVTNPQDGQVIKYDAESGTWLNGADGGGDFSPTISNPQDGDTLVYNATQQKWVNGAASGGGGSLKVTATVDTSSATMKLVMDKTWQEIYDAVSNGNYVGVLFENENILYQMTVIAMSEYDVIVDAGEQGTLTFTANSANDYPIFINPL